MALGVHMLQPQGVIAIDRVNVSEGGVCLRLPTMLEVRSLVRLQLTPNDGPAGRLRPVECTGRVAWVVQRLDLRDMPPFLFDVGIEFVDPPPVLRQLLAQRGVRLASVRSGGRRLPRKRHPASAVVRGRTFIPRLESDASQAVRWHLVVTVDGIPCFSGRYASERLAKTAWAQFQRQQARR